MLTLHQLFIKTSLLFLLAGTVMGALLQVRGAFGPGASFNVETVHIHIMAIGFVLMLIMGVAYWMFPRPSGETPRQAARDPLAWTSYFLLAPGLVLRVLGYLVLPASVKTPVLLLSAALQAGGIFCFIFAIWKRVGMPRAYYREKAELAAKKPANP
jgi:heme/copper-type cytochrome/quinol oxidase subunit 1